MSFSVVSARTVSVTVKLADLFHCKVTSSMQSGTMSEVSAYLQPDHFDSDKKNVVGSASFNVFFSALIHVFLRISSNRPLSHITLVRYFSVPKAGGRFV